MLANKPPSDAELIFDTEINLIQKDVNKIYGLKVLPFYLTGILHHTNHIQLLKLKFPLLNSNKSN